MRKTILIVDDFENTRFVVDFALKQYGYKTLQAGNGIEALKLLDGRPIDLIITDQDMPSMNGIELCRRIREGAIYTDTPTLLLASNKKEHALSKLASGIKVNASICKPFRMDKFIELVTKCLTKEKSINKDKV